MQKKKLLFIVFNTIVIIFYVYPASILGYILFDQPHKQPQITPDFMQISSNHFYTFVLLSIIGLIAFFESHKSKIIFYLFFVSIILEFLHLFIPNRSFQYSDLFGNILGVIISIIIFYFYKFWRN